MATTPVLRTSAELITPPGPVASAVAAIPIPKTQPLWRFALIGLGPLSAMGILALVIAIVQHLA